MCWNRGINYNWCTAAHHLHSPVSQTYSGLLKITAGASNQQDGRRPLAVYPQIGKLDLHSFHNLHCGPTMNAQHIHTTPF